MKRLILIVAALALTIQPALAGPPASGAAKNRKEKLVELKKEKSAAMASHALEAELMKEVRRDVRSGKSIPAGKDSRLANKE
jgi:hypothetical protein